MGHQEPIRKQVPPPAEIPDKLYFRIGEVAKLCAVPAYVLRFWEGEFPQLKPNKGGTGQRLYRRKDVETALKVKSLLYDQGYTIPGARQALKAEMRGAKGAAPVGAEGEGAASTVDMEQMQQLKKELRDLLGMLSRPAGRAEVHPIRGFVDERPMKPRATVRTFPKPKTPAIFDSYDRLFDMLPEHETVK